MVGLRVGLVFVLFCFSCFASAWDVLIFYPQVLDDRQCFIARSARRQKKWFDNAVSSVNVHWRGS